MTIEQSELINKLKMNIREDSAPFFLEEELEYILEENGWEINKASYQALIKKSENDAINLPSGLVMPNNKGYWLDLARLYRQGYGRALTRGD